MQKTCFFILTLLLFAWLPACKSTQSLSHSHTRYLPKSLRNVHFGMPLREAELKRTLDPTEEMMDFRITRLESFAEGDISSIAYYFDAEGEQPLYEVIINYKDVKVRDQVAAELLGPPNYEEEEWRYPTHEGFAVRAWTFKNKLVIVGTLPGTEWEEE